MTTICALALRAATLLGRPPGNTAPLWYRDARGAWILTVIGNAADGSIFLWSRAFLEPDADPGPYAEAEPVEGIGVLLDPESSLRLAITRLYARLASLETTL
jgi:hypothetical protein